MNYVLTILTNGRRVCFERSVHAFFQHVRPLPSAVYVFDDGGQTGGNHVVETIKAAWEKADPGSVWWPDTFYDSSPQPLGMCAAHLNCHDAAAKSEYDWAFHLEDDYVILRPTDLRDLEAVLDAEPTVKQMALVRAPWGKEIEHGGYIPQFPGHYERRSTVTRPLSCDCPFPCSPTCEVPHRAEWISTQRNWATNPALMRTALLREFPWSPVPGCETELGPRILADEPDAVFGLWGWGEPWAAHIALERQPGAHGY